MVYGLIIGNELFHIKRTTNERKYNEICQVNTLHKSLFSESRQIN